MYNWGHLVWVFWDSDYLAIKLTQLMASLTAKLLNFWGLHIYMGVSKNSGTPKSSISIGVSIIFTIHFGVPLYLETPIYLQKIKSKQIDSCSAIDVSAVSPKRKRGCCGSTPQDRSSSWKPPRHQAS